MKYYIDNEGNYMGGWEENPPSGAIEVPGPPGHARQKWDGANWLPLVLTEDEQDEKEIRDDAIIKALLAMRPAQIDTYVDSKIADLETAALFKKLIRVIKILARSL